MVGKHGVVVYSKTYCPFCKKAKTALDAIGAKYEVKAQKKCVCLRESCPGSARRMGPF